MQKAKNIVYKIMEEELGILSEETIKRVSDRIVKELHLENVIILNLEESSNGYFDVFKTEQ